MKQMKWYGILFSLLMLFIYTMGLWDIFMMLGHDPAYYASHGYGEAVHRYFTDYPFCFLILWITNLLCGIMGPILYLLRKKTAGTVMLISCASDGLLILTTSIFRNRIGVLGLSVWMFDLWILAITCGFTFFVKRTEQSTDTQPCRKELL